MIGLEKLWVLEWSEYDNSGHHISRAYTAEAQARSDLALLRTSNQIGRWTLWELTQSENMPDVYALRSELEL